MNNVSVFGRYIVKSIVSNYNNYIVLIHYYFAVERIADDRDQKIFYSVLIRAAFFVLFFYYIERTGEMKKNVWKRILTVGCVATLLTTSFGVMAFASELQKEETLSQSSEEDNIQKSNEKEFQNETEKLEIYTESLENIVGEEDNSTFFVGDNVTAELVIEDNENILYLESNDGTLWENWIWRDENLRKIVNNIDTIKFTENSTKMYLPSSCSGLFSLSHVKTIELDKADTSNVTNMKSMFYGCTSLKELNLSNFNTSKVTDMSNMFCSCSNLEEINLKSFDTSEVTDMREMFYLCRSVKTLDLSNFNTSKVTSMRGMFSGDEKLENLDITRFDTSNVISMREMFENCLTITSLNLMNFDTSQLQIMDWMFKNCRELISLDLSSFDTSKVYSMDEVFQNCYKLTSLNLSSFDTSKERSLSNIFKNCSKLEVIMSPRINSISVALPIIMYDSTGNTYSDLPITTKSIVIARSPWLAQINDPTYTPIPTPTVTPRPTISPTPTPKPMPTRLYTVTPRPTPTTTPTPRPTQMIRDIAYSSVSGISLSYGYSGTSYTPTITVKLQGKTLIKDRDYSVKYIDNKEPGTAIIIITGKGNYTGIKTKTFEIVDCVSQIVSGKTYQFIPKNNSSTAVCSFSGRMVNNTKVYITDRSNSEAMKFKAVKNSDGTWKFINAKCEMSLAVQQNSSEAGKGLVLYDQTTRKAQNWKIVKKFDNSFAIINTVSGLYVAMSDDSAVKGTTLSMEENSGRGQQRFYIAETSAVSAPFDGAYSVKASKNKAYGLNIASSSKTDGANVNLYKYSNINAKKFKVMYSGGGYYRLVNVNSGLVLTVKGNTKANGANVIQSKWASQSGQRWKITKNSNGTVTLKNALGTVLHLNGNKTANGTNVVARNASTTGAQKWYLG